MLLPEQAAQQQQDQDDDLVLMGVQPGTHSLEPEV
jgi:hypothetical protein